MLETSQADMAEPSTELTFCPFRNSRKLYQFVVPPPQGRQARESDRVGKGIGDLTQYVETLAANLDQWTMWGSLQQVRKVRGVCLCLQVVEASGGAGLYTVQHFGMDQAKNIASSKLRLSPASTSEAIKLLEPLGAGDAVVLVRVERSQFLGKHAQSGPPEPAVCSTIAVLSPRCGATES